MADQDQGGEKPLKGAMKQRPVKASRRASLTPLQTLKMASNQNDNTPFLLRNKLRAATRVVDAIEGHATAKGESITISVDRLYTECKIKHRRAERASVGWRFMVFFCVFSATLVMQRNALRGQAFTYGVFDQFVNAKFYSPRSSGNDWPTKNTPVGGCRGFLGEASSEGCQIPPGELKGFRDIVTLDDLWDWTEQLFLSKFYITEDYDGELMDPVAQMTMNYRSKSLAGFRITQKRIAPGSESIKEWGGRCWNYNSGKFRKFAPECYDAFSFCQDASCLFGSESKAPFGTFSDDVKYKHESFAIGGSALGVKEEGFFQFFDKNNITSAREQLATIKNDRWLDKASQWLRFDVAYLNPNERLFLVLRIMLNMDNKGFINPVIASDVTPVRWYNFKNYLDILRLVLEISCFVGWAWQVWDLAKAVWNYKIRARISWKEALSGFWSTPENSWIVNLLIVNMFVVFILWFIVIADPLKNDIVVTPQSMSYKTLGTPLFLTQVANFERSYFIVNGLNCLLFVARILQVAKVNPRFSLLSESVDAMQGRLFNFAIVMFILLVFFTAQAMVMFGDKLAVFADFGYAFVTVVQMLMGAGTATIDEDISRRGGGFGALRAVDYPDIFKVSPWSAWLFYYPFVFMMVFVVVNITIAIIGEAYVRVKKQRNPDDPDFNLCPSEAVARKPIPIMVQIRRGTGRRIGRLFRKERNVERRKEDIITLCEKLPKWLDRDCCSVGDLADIAGPLGFTRESILWLTERYPVIINTRDILEDLLKQRTPAQPTVEQQVEHVTASVEELVNTQAGIHAKLDLLIKMATV